jgi:hypothetical protein
VQFKEAVHSNKRMRLFLEAFKIKLEITDLRMYLNTEISNVRKVS